jgi:hypothetical protein
MVEKNRFFDFSAKFQGKITRFPCILQERLFGQKIIPDLFYDMPWKKFQNSKKKIFAHFA